MRVVQAGAGSWGAGWLAVLGEADGVELVGVADPSPVARSRARAAAGLVDAQLFETLEEALAGTEADAVLVATPPGTHHDVTVAALAGGRHVLTEKPLATTMADARRLVQAADEAGRILMVSQNYRFRIPARTLLETVAGGAVGRPVHVSVACRRDTRGVFGAGDFRYRMRHPYVLDMMIHHVDLIRAVTGQDAVEVVCRSWPVPDSPYEHHPAAAALMTLSGGTVVTYAGDWASRSTETPWSGEWEVLGERGRVVLRQGERDDDARSGVVTLRVGEAAPQPVPLADPGGVDRHGTIAAFRRAVEEGAPVVTPAADNIRSLAVVLACVESIESGAPVDVAALLAG